MVGAAVVAVTNAADARASYRDWRPDLLISDIGLPAEDGLDLIRSLRKIEADLGTHVPSIALTAFASSADRGEALSAGFDAYMTKPVVSDSLIRCINQVMTPNGEPDC
jgi:CheY-like chemotaxis protein